MIHLSRRVIDTAKKSYGMCDKGAAFVPQDGLIHLELGRLNRFFATLPSA